VRSLQLEQEQITLISQAKLLIKCSHVGWYSPNLLYKAKRQA